MHIRVAEAVKTAHEDYQAELSELVDQAENVGYHCEIICVESERTCVLRLIDAIKRHAEKSD